jgi:hypothetical protein
LKISIRVLKNYEDGVARMDMSCILSLRRPALYIQRNIEELLLNHCEKAISVTYPEDVFLALGIQQ